MIISHKHQFIFIKTAKTAGTSMEIALSRFCGEDDIITSLFPEDEEIRKRVGGRSPQNEFIPYSRYSKLDILRSIYHQKRLKYNSHAGSTFIRQYIGEKIWNKYYKFCFERNPWDKIISLYYWLYRHNIKEAPSLSMFIQSGIGNGIYGFELYTRNARVIVDDVYLYEDMDKALPLITKRLGLKDSLELPWAKAIFRQDKRNYRDVLSINDRVVIEKVFAREIAYHGYRW